jgi:hypothetical protein
MDEEMTLTTEERSRLEALEYATEARVALDATRSGRACSPAEPSR